MKKEQAKQYAIKSNVRLKIMNAWKAQDTEALHKAAQEAFEAGLELEELNLLPTVFSQVANILFETGWAPDSRPLMD